MTNTVSSPQETLLEVPEPRRKSKDILLHVIKECGYSGVPGWLGDRYGLEVQLSGKEFTWLTHATRLSVQHSSTHIRVTNLCGGRP